MSRGAVVLACLLAAGCGDGAMIIVEVTSDLAIPDELTGLEVSATSSDVSGNPCVPLVDDVQLESASQLPYRIGYHRGGRFNVEFAVRVVGRTRAEEEIRVDTKRVWPSEGIQTVTVPVDRVCLEAGCPEDGYCWDGACFSPVADFDGLLESPGAELCEADK